MSGATLPVAGGSIIQGPGGAFGPSTGTHSDFGNWESDNAVDIAVPTGTPVYAVAAGTIGPQFGSLDSTNPQLAGLRLHLNESTGTSFYYAHLSAFAPGIRPGSTVAAGQLLGYSGAANGVEHLHFAVSGGSPLDYVAGLPSKVADAIAGGTSSSDPTAAAAVGASGAGCATLLAAMFAVWALTGYASGVALGWWL